MASGTLPAPTSKAETVHACWPIDASGLLTGTSVQLPLDPAVLAYQAQQERFSVAWDNRVDFVFVGDGYTSAQMGQYTNNVTNVVANFFQFEPFISYRPYFRITQVDVVSNQSGVDNDPQGTFRDTALDMSYWCSGIERLLCVNVSKAYAAITSAGVPDIDQVIALANSAKYGGAGYSSSNLGTAAGRNSSAVQIAIHEIGHSMGDLADEYDYADGTTFFGPDPAAANASIYTAAEQVAQNRKWFQWVGTTGDPTFDDPISSYEGAVYKVFGIYRPSPNSMMRSLFRQFNQPSAEALIKNIYIEVVPIDASASNALPLGATDTAWVTPMRPVGHSLQIRWTIDSLPAPSLNGVESVAINSLALSSAVHTVEVTVTDTTSMVRDEAFRAAWMTQAKAWTVDLSCVNPADMNGDGIVDNGDITLFVSLFLASDLAADLNGDGVIDNGDIGAFVGAFLNPC